MANDIIGIKYTDSIYVTRKGKTFNICVIAITQDNRKIASSYYITQEDLDALYESYKVAITKNHSMFVSELSSGNVLLNRFSLPTDNGLIPLYNISLRGGEFKSRMSPSAYDQFMYTIKINHEYLHKSSRRLSSLFRPKSSRRKKKKGVFDKDE